MSVKVNIFMNHENILIYPVASENFTTLKKNSRTSIFMKIPIYTSLVSVFIEVQILFSSENDWTS